MQPKIILTSLLVGIASAMPQGIISSNAKSDGGNQGLAVDGPQGTDCIGSHNETSGPPQSQGTCPKPNCQRIAGCEKLVKGPSGCDICRPRCAVHKNSGPSQAQSTCPGVVCLKLAGCVAVKGPDGCDICAPGCALDGQNKGPSQAQGTCPGLVCLRMAGCDAVKGPDGCDICPPGCEVGS